MIYVRLRGKVGEIFAQIIYAEKIAKQYNQDIRLYINGSFNNHKEYYENELIPSGIFQNYQFVEEYPTTIPVLFEGEENFQSELERRGTNGEDIVIEGDFYKQEDFDYEGFRTKFSPSQELLDYMATFSIGTNSLYIEAQPLITNNKNEFALAGKLLEWQLSGFNDTNFDKVFVKTDWPDFFKTVGFEKITGVENITYICTLDIPEKFRTATDVMFPYLCKSCVISNYLSSWWGHVMNSQEGHEAGLLFPYGKIKNVSNAPDGISQERIEACILMVGWFSAQEKQKQFEGEDSAFDNVFFEKEIENIDNIDNVKTEDEE